MLVAKNPVHRALLVNHSQVKDEYKEIFKLNTLLNNIIEINESTVKKLQSSINTLNKDITSKSNL